MSVTFTKFSETANYYSKASRTTGKSVWNQNELENQFMNMISNCNLTKEQVESLSAFMSVDNAKKFNEMVTSKNLENNSKSFVA